MTSDRVGRARPADSAALDGCSAAADAAVQHGGRADYRTVATLDDGSWKWLGIDHARWMMRNLRMVVDGPPLCGMWL